MGLQDRIAPLCDLLLGAAHADAKFEDREDDAVRAVLTELAGDIPVEVEAQMAQFDPDKHSVEESAKAFANDPIADRARVLSFVAAINDADDEVDFAEDEYLREVCKALGLPDSSLEGLVVDVEEIAPDFDKIVRKPPPPPPGSKKSVDVDLS